MNMALEKVSNSAQMYPDMNTALLVELRDDHDEHSIREVSNSAQMHPDMKTTLLVE